MFEKNKFIFVELIKKEFLDALVQTQYMRFDKFDVEMANATANGFEMVSNVEQARFISLFEEM